MAALQSATKVTAAQELSAPRTVQMTSKVTHITVRSLKATIAEKEA